MGLLSTSMGQSSGWVIFSALYFTLISLVWSEWSVSGPFVGQSFPLPFLFVQVSIYHWSLFTPFFLFFRLSIVSLDRVPCREKREFTPLFHWSLFKLHTLSPFYSSFGPRLLCPVYNEPYAERLFKIFLSSSFCLFLCPLQLKLPLIQVLICSVSSVFVIFLYCHYFDILLLTLTIVEVSGAPWPWRGCSSLSLKYWW